MKDGSRNKALYVNSGSILLITVFAIAMLSTLVVGILEANTSEIQLVQNQLYAAQALALAEAGLNKAMAQIRNDPTWTQHIPSVTQIGDYKDTWVTGSLPANAEEFGDGYYTLGFDGGRLVITAGVKSWRGYTAIIEAQVTISPGVPHIIRIDNLKVNEYAESGG